MYEKCCIIVLVGLPGCGKTQFVSKIIPKMIDFAAVHVEYDKIYPLSLQLKWTKLAVQNDILEKASENENKKNIESGNNLEMESRKDVEKSNSEISKLESELKNCEDDLKGQSEYGQPERTKEGIENKCGHPGAKVLTEAKTDNECGVPEAKSWAEAKCVHSETRSWAEAKTGTECGHPEAKSWAEAKTETGCSQLEAKPDTEYCQPEARSWAEARRYVLESVRQLISQPGIDNWIFRVLDSKLKDSERLFIFIDDNMYLRSMRYKYFQLARQLNIGFCEVYLKTNLEHCLVRNNQRNRRVPDDVIRRIHQRLEEPNCLWENCLTIDAEKCSEHSSDVCRFIVKALDSPVPPLYDPLHEQLESREQCLKSVQHQADKVLRKAVSKHVHTSTLKQSAAKEANEIRQKLLNDIKAYRVGINVPLDDKTKFDKCIDDMFKLELRTKMDVGPDAKE